jgi:hypothetical protein
MMLCSLPSSSCINHLTVPTLVFVVCPLKPRILISDRVGGFTKSCRLLVVDWLQQLSTNISFEYGKVHHGLGLLCCGPNLNSIMHLLYEPDASSVSYLGCLLHLWYP